MTLLTSSARGVYVIAVTPFDPSGALDLPSVDRMVDFYAGVGAQGITLLGMMGEAPKLTFEESRLVVERVLRRSGGLPVIVGVSAPGMASMSQLAASAMELGAAGVMVAPPATLRTDEQIVGYYRLVADTLGRAVPIVVQDFPLVTTVHFSPSVLDRIVEEVEGVVMLKHEDWPGLNKITALRAAEAKGRRRISILTGNGGLFLPEEMERGADGAMTGFAYPEMMVEVCRLSEQGETERARDVFDAYLPLARYEQQPGLGLAVRKHLLARRGVIASPALRRPGPRLSSEDLREIDRLVARQERRLGEIG